MVHPQASSDRPSASAEPARIGYTARSSEGVVSELSPMLTLVQYLTIVAPCHVQNTGRCLRRPIFQMPISSLKSENRWHGGC